MAPGSRARHRASISARSSRPSSLHDQDRLLQRPIGGFSEPLCNVYEEVDRPSSNSYMSRTTFAVKELDFGRFIMRADFSSQDFFRNPAAEIEKLRSVGPVVDVRFPIIGKVWTTTTQDLADRVLKDSETFTVRRDDGTVAGFRWWMPRILLTLSNHMLSMDEPDHRRLRDIVDEAFRRRAMHDMEPRILAIADELAGDLFAQGSPADLVDRYARKLPLSVICELLGLPLADRPKFTAWASAHHARHGTRRLLQHDPESLGDEALSGATARNASASMVARASSPSLCEWKRKAGRSAAMRWWRWSSCSCSRGTRRPRI